MLIELYLYLPKHFGSWKGQKLLGVLCFLSKAGMASGLATEMLFSTVPYGGCGGCLDGEGSFFP